ncbi:hypothetical protein EXN61_14305 [Agrobacterium tumefaciens]|uniref:Uncharacterized protein n=1 Tax=Agrobacterium tumefaciens TaxID=358 RepID=A0A546Y018_AGRTU|nr:hypothetical protein [Agrobacterium tumefaciens]TRB06345.1 hypothetical protein EXN61_14305 [Agrobacterium tumefaciens]
MNKIKAAGDTKEDVLADKIKTLRAYRDRFRIDPPFDALQQEIEFHSLIDPIHQIQVGLGDPDKFYPGLFKGDPAKIDATDRAAEKRREITEILLYRLEYDDFDMARLRDLGEERRKGTGTLSEEENIGLRMLHQRGAEMLFEDGYTARERRIIQLVDPGFSFKANPKVSHETIAFNKSLNPVQHRNNHVNRMEIVAANPLDTKRPRSDVKKNIQGVMRGRKHWRVRHIFKACEVMDDLIVHLGKSIPNYSSDPTIDELSQRYRFPDLFASNSSRISSSFYAELAAAIASAEHRTSGTDDYVPNDDLAIKAMRHYGLFEKAKRAVTKFSPRSKDLIFKNFQRFYAGAI